jgi:hypothetical protein
VRVPQRDSLDRASLLTIPGNIHYAVNMLTGLPLASHNGWTVSMIVLNECCELQSLHPFI